MTDQLAVVTGASTGIGYHLARIFIENGFDVIGCADDDRLHDATAELTRGSASFHAVQADLSTSAGIEQAISAVNAFRRPVDALALNAGIGNSGAFIDIPWEDERRLLGLNIGSTVHLAKALLPAMVARGQGRLLITSSVAAHMPGPYYATYAASKSFVLSFAEAIRHELVASGVTVTALLPGPTDTEFFDRADMADTPVADASKDDPADVAREGFHALMAGKDSVVAGSFKNKLQAAGARLLSEPRKAQLHAGMTEPRND
ncbi:MAG: SDR family NAD(P)-dependent oxidoreductase [Actinobacteria bacterium]|nr:SDR family NAD(P)-dependent oxidoreductase [Actinomycetota bacterium]